MRLHGRRIRWTAVVLLVAGTAACGDSDQAAPAEPPASVAPSFAPADVEFVVHLSQHHGQALHLAELAASRARSPAVKGIAAEIATAYAPQVDTLADWIRTWVEAGAELPPHDIGHDEAGPGMLAEDAVTRLESLRGPAFDRQFRKLMVRHHRGGLDLVAEQLRDGINPEARALAELLRASQTAHLSQLR